VVVALWGGAPGYANSLALADLPRQQMNPSAFALGLVLLLWTWVRGGAERGRGSTLLWPVLGVVGAVALLTHGMTGVFGFGGLLLIALVAPADRRGRLLLAFAAITAVAAGLCVARPWFNFLEAVRSPKDLDYWFNGYILQVSIL
jgi:4-amino-4-deoxy-L-arabinose transferase-like glycosyltransferase